MLFRLFIGMTVHRLKPWQIFRFADKFDIFLMIIGTIAGLFHFSFDLMYL